MSLGVAELLAKGKAQDDAVAALMRVGVVPKVAENLVYSQCHPLESVQAAISNARALEAKHRADGTYRMSRFTIGRYTVGALNRARQEGHVVAPSKLFRQQKELASRLTEDRRTRGIRPPVVWTPEKKAEIESKLAEIRRRLAG